MFILSRIYKLCKVKNILQEKSTLSLWKRICTCIFLLKHCILQTLPSSLYRHPYDNERKNIVGEGFHKKQQQMLEVLSSSVLLIFSLFLYLQGTATGTPLTL